MRILSINAGYFLGYDGTVRDYVRHPLRAIKGDKILTNQKVQSFSRLVAQENPDAVLMQEVDQGSIRAFEEADPRVFSGNLSGEFKPSVASKYSGLLSQTPFLGKMSNAILSKKGEVKNHYLESGRKSLVQELRLDDYSIFSVHLSRFLRDVREAQLNEISELTSDRDNFAVVGDFNFHRNHESEKAAVILDAKKNSPGKTFPTGDLRKSLDMVFNSGLDVQCEAIDSSISDHRPILIDIRP